MIHLQFGILGPEIAKTFAKLPSLTRKQINHLKNLGVDEDACFFDWCGNWSIIRSAMIELLPNHRFEFSMQAHGSLIPVLIIEVMNELGELVDLLAFRSNGEWALWLGRVPVLGLEYIHAPRIDEQLTVHRSIFDYIRAQRKGILILDPERARIALEDAGPLLAEDQYHGQDLLLNLSYSPKVFYPIENSGRLAA
jgi:hypothetical protein